MNVNVKVPYNYLRNLSGFTILELMVALAIIAILAAVAIASTSALIPRAQVKSATQKMRTDLQKAKMEAIKSNRECLVTFTAGESGSFRACFDENADDNCDNNDTIIASLDFTDYKHAELDDVSTAFTNGDHFRFNTRGMPTSDTGGMSAGSVNIDCSSDSNYSLTIALSFTGRIRIN
ncbi:MAG: GspH/FimT family protein [Desulfobacteraceae bacterium]|nr:GspH/FimT family protein [Desulfobacteraceae bacterium]